jgi:hypothetical protein
MGEMESSKRLLLAGAIVAVVALAVPALASAAVWKHGGSNLNKFVSLGLTGGELFSTSSENGMSCELHATLTTEGGSTGEITAFETKKCPVGFGTFAKCELNTAQAVGLPWTVHVNATDLTITNWRTKRTFKGTGCTVGELDKNLGSVTMTLESPAAISEVLWIDEITGYKSGGSFAVDGANKGTYGIG